MKLACTDLGEVGLGLAGLRGYILLLLTHHRGQRVPHGIELIELQRQEEGVKVLAKPEEGKQGLLSGHIWSVK